MRPSLVLVSVCIAGCGVTLRVGDPGLRRGDPLAVPERAVQRCIRAVPGAQSPYREDLAGPETEPSLVGYLQALPPDARRTAVAAGIEPLVARVLREHARSGGAPTVELLSLRQELDERLAALPPQMLALEFECECSVALLARVLAAHDGMENDRQLELTIASLVAGAVSTLAAGVWDLANAHTGQPAVPDGPLLTGLVGAGVTTALGAAVLLPAPRALTLSHQHNLLVPLKRGEDGERLYPTFVLRMLTLPTASGEPTPREALLARWDGLIGDAAGENRALVEALLFGPGGVYDVRTAALRQALLEDLETTLDSLVRHVDSLTKALAQALARPPGP
ncbi:MAG: hypothetical protein INH41_00810 [Myxococcaceae bacterium]|nr:hypothetical protein [Myxococcaceae bacterium]MCA3010918.1 hypothetical protein [Myxococcaceae bacterium]